MAEQPPVQPPPPEAPPPMAPPPQAPPPSTGGTGLQPNVAGALAYITWIGGLVILLIEKDNREVKFHAWQSLILWGGWTIAAIVLGIVFAFFPFGIHALLSLLLNLVWLAVLVGAIYAGVKAYQGVVTRLPIVGDIAAQQAGI